MKKLLAVAVTTILAGTSIAHAGFMMGRGGEAASAAIETISSFTDEQTSAALQAQQEAVTELQTQLKDLLAAEEQDADAISEIRSQLHDARHELGDEIKQIVSENDEIKTALSAQREAMRAERAVTRYALTDDDAYAALVAAASEDQVAALDANQQAIEALKTQASEARDAGASRSEIREIRDQIRELASEQAEVVSEVLDANESLQESFSTAASEAVSEMRPHRGGRRHH